MDFEFKKKFGQNFLQDQNILKNIVKSANIEPNSLVIEVGPGSGNLTCELCVAADNVLCYEIDTSLEEILSERLYEFSNIQVIYDDFLKRDIKKDIEKFEYDNLYLVANLPYYITTPIIEKVINSNLPFKQITIMIQKEVGERFMAHPKTREYGSITVFLNYYFDIKREFLVSRNAFFPKPNVDSIVISLKRKEELLYLKDKDFFNKLLRDAFKFKRKTIKNNLKNYNLDIISQILSENGYSLTSRAEELPIEVFVELANKLV